MQIQWIFFMALYSTAHCDDRLMLIAKTHETRLEKYVSYVDSAILHFRIPEDTSLASFKFRAEEIPLSLFSCTTQDVTVYLKQGSPPVINPDGSSIPDKFLKYGRPTQHLLTFKSDNANSYINVTSPLAGSYFVAAFNSYTDPKDAAITQQGLTADCMTFLNAELYITKPKLRIISDGDLHVILEGNTSRLYKFKTPDVADIAFLHIEEMSYLESCMEIIIQLQQHVIPAPNNTLYDIKLSREGYNNKEFKLHFPTLENSWYYLKFLFNASEQNASICGEFILRLNYYTSNVTYNNETINTKVAVTTSEVEQTDPFVQEKKSNESLTFRYSLMKSFARDYTKQFVPTQSHYLIRDGHTESFVYSFDLHPTIEGVVPLILNITSTDVILLKFHINSLLDTGGSLHLALAFKPKIKSGRKFKMLEDDTRNLTLIGCIRNGEYDSPMLPNKCAGREEINTAPIIINRKSDNNSIYVPFPEPGDWYLTFQLFCEKCIPCNCSNPCRLQYKGCRKRCETTCSSFTDCNLCIDHCERAVSNRTECSNCDCEGPCHKSNDTCKAKVVFAIASFPCVNGKCGENGKCVYLVSEGLAYSSCICSNGYRGWSCEDGSQTTSYAMIILELLLLVLSNLMFLPAAYIAFRRKYYVEGIIYFSTCFFSSFYHACDAGENVYSFCLVRLEALQFSDFFCGLLSIWVTIIAMADLPKKWVPYCHIGGCIVLAFFTALDKVALWVFAIPFLTGTLILIGSWYMHYKKTGKKFPSKRYLCILLPCGLACVGLGLLMFALLQTQSNYKYLHSLWHILMAVSVIILLPKKETFYPVPSSIENTDS